MKATFRPLPAWPYPPQKKRPATYRSTYARTLEDLEREIDNLKGREVIIGAGFRAQDIRLDGLPRSDARSPMFSGVEVSFEVPDGRRLTFHTDVHDGYSTSWQDNLRAIALGLEALRAVERYGITTGVGQQYAGFAQLTAGGPDPARGAVLVERHGSITAALKATHPDHGGDPHDFADVQAFRELER